MTRQEIIDTIIPAMVLAPSAHNTQPWTFKVADSQIEIYVDESRHLAVSDPLRRELYLGLGCAIMNARVALAYYGQAVQVMYAGQDISSSQLAVRIAIQAGSPDQTIAHLFPYISQRRTDRSLYDNEPLTAEEKVKLAANSVGSSMLLVDDHQHIERLAAITERGTYESLSRPDFKNELSHWVRNSWTKQPDGMPGYAMGMPAVVSLLAPLMVRVAPIHKQEAPKARQQMMSSSMIAVVMGEANTPQSWLQSGEELERIWLTCTSLNLSAAPLASAIEASPQTYQQLKEIIKTANEPHAILRIGHGRQNLKATPRRTIQDCLT